MEPVSVRWTELYNYGDPYNIVNMIIELLLEVLKKYAPLRKITPRQFSLNTCSSSVSWLAGLDTLGEG